MASLAKAVLDEREKEMPAAEAGEGQASPAVGVPIHVTDETFEELVLNAPVPALLDFWAPWCSPCRMVGSIVEDLARVFGEELVVAKINTDENVQVATEYGILGLPTLLLFRDGQEVDRVVGLASRKSLEARLEALLTGGEDETAS